MFLTIIYRLSSIAPLTNNLTITPTAVIGITLLIFSLILLAVPGRSGSARFVKFLLFMGMLGISGLNTYMLFTSDGSPFLNGSIEMHFPHSFFVHPTSLSILTSTLLMMPAYTPFDYIGAAANILTIITNVIGIIQQLNGDPKK
jgi:hypothetical protein